MGGHQAGRLGLRQTYTYSDFHYRDDARFGNNRLPGLPQHYYQAELRYDHPSGVYTGFNVQHASRIAVDYANSYHAAAYTLFGASLGYSAPDESWQTWVDLRNLTNKRYASTVTPATTTRAAMLHVPRRAMAGVSTPASRGACAEQPMSSRPA